METWRFNGACGNHDPDIWFPVTARLEDSARAKAICLTCPVRGQCLNYAVSQDIRHGVWGGMTTIERDIMTAREKRAWNATPAGEVEHGTAQGYMWHRRYSRPACDLCLAAERERGAARRAAREREAVSA